MAESVLLGPATGPGLVFLGQPGEAPTRVCGPSPCEGEGRDWVHEGGELCPGQRQL